MDLVIWFFAGVGVASTLIYVVLGLHRMAIERRYPQVPPPDRSTIRPAQLADEQARYIRSVEKQS